MAFSRAWLILRRFGFAGVILGLMRRFG